MIDEQNALKLRTYIENYYILDVEYIGSDVIIYRAEDMKYDRVVWLHEYFPASMAKRHHKDDEQYTVYVHPTQSELFLAGKTEFQNIYTNLKMVNHPSVPVVYELSESSGTILVSTKYNANTKLLRHHLNNSTKIFLEQQVGILALSIVRAFVLLQDRQLQMCLINPDTILIDNRTKEPIVAYAKYINFDEQAIQNSIYELGMLLYEMIDKENLKNSEPLQPLKPNKTYSAALCGLVNRMVSKDTSKHFKTFQELRTLLQSYESTREQCESIVCEKEQKKSSSFVNLAGIIIVSIFLYYIFIQEHVDAKNLTWFDSARYHLVAYFGNVKGQNALGQMYEKGYYVDANIKEAILWYKKAAQQGDVNAQLNLAYLYGKVDSVKDNKAAFEINLKLAKAGNRYAQRALGYSYIMGEGTPKDYKQAMHWLYKAQEQGDAYSCGAIGWMYESGFGVEENLTKALEWFKKGAARNDKYSKDSLVNLEKKIKNLDETSLHDKSQQEYNLGYQYENGTKGVKDHKQAVEHYTSSAKLGNVYAAFNLAQLYENSEQIPRDYSSAFYWYKKAAEYGDALAYYCVSQLYRSGHGVKKDEKLAFEWCKKAAERGVGVAQGMMGSCYEHGWGTYVSYRKARYWYELAIKSGYDNAVGRLEKLEKKLQKEDEVVVNREQQPKQNQKVFKTNNLDTSVNIRPCLACHGKNFERHALGKSAIVANMSSREIEIALKGYKSGTYGGPMKVLMKGQVAKYSDTALEYFSRTIGR